MSSAGGRTQLQDRDSTEAGDEPEQPKGSKRGQQDFFNDSDKNEDDKEEEEETSEEDIEVTVGDDASQTIGKVEERDDTKENGRDKSYGLSLYEETLDLYELVNYTFGKKDVVTNGILTKGVTEEELEDHLRKQYKERGMRRSVAGVLLVYSHHFPHVLLLQRADGTGSYFLPGGKLRPGESNEDGLKRKLSSKLSPVSPVGDEDDEWDIGDLICNWWAIDFSARKYPYVPSHVTKPTERLKVYLVTLPEKYMFAVPKNLQLVAVPLFELLSRATDYGPIIASIPALLAKYHVNYI